MDHLAAMTEVAGRVHGLGGLRAFPTPPDSAPVPFACCGAPETPNGVKLTYSRTGARGASQLTLPLLVAVAKVTDRVGWAELMAFTSDTGPNSVVLALEEPDEYTAFDTLAVSGWEIGETTLAGVELLGVTFELDITG